MKLSEHWQIGWNVSPDTNNYSQLIDDGMEPNLGTGSQNLEMNWKIILSHTLSHFQILKLIFLGPKFYCFDWISDLQPISQSTIDGKWHDWGAGSLIWVGGSSQQKSQQNEKLYFQKYVPFLDMKLSEHTI